MPGSVEQGVTVLQWGFAGAAVLVGLVAQPAPQFGREEVIRALTEVGATSIESPEGRDVVRARLEGIRISVFLGGPDEAQLYAAWQSEDPRPVVLERVNSWNAQARFTRAYVDAQDDPVLEADLEDPARLSAQLSRFADSAQRFGVQRTGNQD